MVGDEKQSIYAFRAADVGQLLNAQKEFGDMKIVQMGENFRSTEQVVNVANAIADLMHEDQKVTDGHMIAMANIQGDKPIARQFANDKDEA
ncbi:UvrD-helicase domain-containing protein, partial [Vibrio parahaemolyticus]|nr:UvrD-helicase domain-containing protein [Vibrio parahaemolyticus]